MLGQAVCGSHDGRIRVETIKNCSFRRFLTESGENTHQSVKKVHEGCRNERKNGEKE